MSFAVPHRPRGSHGHSAAMLRFAFLLLLSTGAAATLVLRPGIGMAEDATASVQVLPGVRVGVGDKLRLRFFDRYDSADLNGDYVIRDDGLLRLPRIGDFIAQNRLPTEIESDVRTAIERRGEKLGYFSIEVVETRPIYVTGFTNKPGSYPYAPGLTVLHAVSLAGGIYRSQSLGVADGLRERAKLVETMDRLKEVIAKKARFTAERDGAEKVEVPPELIQLDPLHAGQMIDRENTLLQRQRAVTEGTRTGLENVSTLTQTEAQSYQTSISAIDTRLQEQTSLFDELKRLHEANIINRQRYYEAVAGLDNVQRDKQLAIAGLSHAQVSLEKSAGDLAMLKLSGEARIAADLRDADAEIARLRELADQSRELIASLATLGGGESENSIIYKIMRRDSSSNNYNFLNATVTTPLMPGDVIQVEKLDASAAKLN